MKKFPQVILFYIQNCPKRWWQPWDFWLPSTATGGNLLSCSRSQAQEKPSFGTFLAFFGDPWLWGEGFFPRSTIKSIIFKPICRQMCQSHSAHMVFLYQIQISCSKNKEFQWLKSPTPKNPVTSIAWLNYSCRKQVQILIGGSLLILRASSCQPFPSLNISEILFLAGAFNPVDNY